MADEKRLNHVKERIKVLEEMICRTGEGLNVIWARTLPEILRLLIELIDEKKLGVPPDRPRGYRRGDRSRF